MRCFMKLEIENSRSICYVSQNSFLEAFANTSSVTFFRLKKCHELYSFTLNVLGLLHTQEGCKGHEC